MKTINNWITASATGVGLTQLLGLSLPAWATLFTIIWLLMQICEKSYTWIKILLNYWRNK